ncbi:DUF2850 domain-containing protein [Vibrio cholerae]|uniref:DUF2850 domain-containing protein n=1 Tax=Vibrio cholerae TaxID=666 RepID=UPI0006E572DB|nr:DUF2850 domain-containing protein [Vibrio cholerae]EJK2991739.1 DUF2850 domain-containing protein [Vibrio cholerae]EJL6902402.1 DUF2850 domain-containing protein [Vibrio cholerae]KQA31571.1 hypothetical protein XV72_13690 [Vibrio cholerae]KQA37707.1 hypothetical protein XV73_00815 [Vibrio cholerae]KQA41879.1 hypothetical protein XV76_14280 [Vibrio cholerae]
MSKELVFKSVFWSSLSILGVAFAMLLYVSYQDYVNPKHVFGSWIEIGAPNYQTEVLRFNEQGVYRNDRLISTNFEFDGTAITIRTGSGIFVYELSGTFNSPQLKRTQPINPVQRFIRQGFEHTVSDQGNNAAQLRRSALSEHFNEK